MPGAVTRRAGANVVVGRAIRGMGRTGLIGVLVAAALAISISSVARAGHTLPANTGGDCWRAGTPVWCRASWASAPYNQVRLRFIDQFSGQEPGWLDNAEVACNSWHNYIGSGSYADIQCHWTAVAYDSYVYWKWADPPLPSGVLM